MSQYKPYPAYKDTGVEWLGRVPAHWTAKKLLYWISGYGSGTTPSKEEEYSADGIPWVTTGELRENTVSATEKCVTQEAVKNNSALKIHPAGSLVIAMYGATVGRLGVLGTDATLNQACFAIHPGKKIQTSYLRNWFEGFRNELLALAAGAGQPNISGDKIRNLLLPCPEDLSEQAGIISHLDRETARIDALVEKKTRFIELLREKRQALITHAVTKGLDPKAKMKDSGVEWLGEIPEHWRFELLTNVCAFESGKAHEPFIDDEGRFICVNSRFVSTEGKSKKFCTHNLSPASENDILMVMSDLPNGRALAKAFYVDKSGVYAVNQRVCIISPKDCNARFMFYLLDRNAHFLSHDDGINQTHLPNSAFTKFKFYLPPEPEQKKICDYLDKACHQIQRLVARTERSIELLKERRSALITAAVTGQIDLRESA